MKAILLLPSLALALIRLFGGAVGAIWLLVVGEWQAVGVGLLALVIATFALPLAHLPGLWVFGTPAAVLQRGPNPSRAKPFYALIGMYTVVLMGAWCLFCVWLFLPHAEPGTRIPYLLWSYAVATVPWSRFARAADQREAQEAKQQGRPALKGPNAQAVIFLLQLAYLCGGVAWLFGWLPFHLAALPFWGLALVVNASAWVRHQQARDEAQRNVFRRPGTVTLEGEGRTHAGSPTDPKESPPDRESR